MLLAKFVKALGAYLRVLNEIILDAYHREIESFDEAINWVTDRSRRLEAAKRRVDQLAGTELVTAVVAPADTDREQWMVELLAMIADSYHAVNYLFTSGPPRAQSDDPRAEIAASVVNSQLEVAGKLMRDLDVRRRFLEAAVQCRQSQEVPQFILDCAQAGTPIFTADEVVMWSEGLFDQLLARGIIEPTENSGSVACDACGRDHVETVEFIQSPEGSPLRAYIWCSHLGRRVPVSLDRLRRWMVDTSKIPLRKDSAPATIRDSDAKESDAAPVVKPENKPQSRQKPGLRSWTQTDLDDAIREYKASRSSTYGDLVNGVKLGKAGARKSARKLFGRNAIARALGAKAPAMVSNSPVWQEIADELKLRGVPKSPGPSPQRRIGMDIAIEEKAVSDGEAVVDQVIRQETVCIVQEAMPRKEAEATIEKLVRGEISDDQARELTEVFGAQTRDARTRKVRQTP